MRFIGSFLAAIRFLTIVPVPFRTMETERELAASTFYFPLVGALIGLTAACAGFALEGVLPAAPRAVLLVALLLAVSGGLHMDGLADCGDGFFSSRPRQQILEIMKDSRIGAMGVIAIVLVLLLKYAAISSMSGDRLLVALFLAPVAGRCAILLSMGILPYARPEGGLGGLFYGDYSRRLLLWGLLWLLVPAWFVLRDTAVVGVLASMAGVLLFCLFCRARIGGATGDTLGASCEIAETLMLLGFCAG